MRYVLNISDPTHDFLFFDALLLKNAIPAA